MEKRTFSQELRFKTSRGGGPGGQHVNKVATAVVVFWNVQSSMIFTAEEKALLMSKLGNYTNADGDVVLHARTARTQLDNKRMAIQKIHRLVFASLKKQKPRKKTKPSKSQVERRIRSKKQQAEKKAMRRKDW